MSNLVYNTVAIPYPLTTQFSQEAVYDPQGGTDWIQTKYDIIVDGILNLELLETMITNANPPTMTSPSQLMKLVRLKLMKPRKRLSYVVNGIDLIPDRQSEAPGSVDVKNGPQPQHCNITQVTAETFLFSYRIVAHYWERLSAYPGESGHDPNNPFRGQEGNTILANRWTESVEIDSCDYSTRTREGTFILRSDNTGGFIADQVRSQFAVLSIPYGFTRKSRNYTQSPDGMSLSYRIVDTEQYRLPPSPAFEAEGYYNETVTGNGAVRVGEVFVRLKGSKHVVRRPGQIGGQGSQGDLIRAALTVALQTARVRGGNLGIRFPPQGTPFSVIERASVRRGLYENVVEVSIRGLYRQVADRLLGLAGFVGMDTTTALSEMPGADKTNVPGYLERGSARLLLQAAAYYDPSSVGNEIGTGHQRIENNPPTTLETYQVQMQNGFLPGQAGKTEEGN